MTKLKYFTVLFSFLAISINSQAQLLEFGKPFSWNISSSNQIPTYVCQKMNNLTLQMKYNVEKFDKSFRFGEEINVNLNIIKLAAKTTLSDGGILYQYKIQSKNAVSLNFVFSQFVLKKGSLMYISDKERNTFTGAYSFLNMNNENTLGTDLIKSDNAIIEVYEPKENIGTSKIILSQIVHGFQDADTQFAKVFGGSGGCNYDVNCPIGNDFQDQKNGIALTISGGLACSGSLVNNTSGNVIPYYLTARHCGLSTSTWVLRFNWERDAANVICAQTNSTANNGITTHTITGTTLKATDDTSDFTLVLLDYTPDISWNVFYNGWNHADTADITNVTVIHHPSQDIKKISKSSIPPYKWGVPFNGSTNCQTWRVEHWDFGVTEPGSSGSPLFDQNKRIIGSLSGGSSACNGLSPNTGFDAFGRFGVSWNTFIDTARQLKHWLDPISTNSTYIDGVYQNQSPTLDLAFNDLSWLRNSICQFTSPFIIVQNTGNITITTAKIKYSFNGNADTIIWNGNLNQYESDTISIAFPALSDGNVIFSEEILSVNNTTDAGASNNFLTANFNYSNSNKLVKIEFGYDYYTSEISWKLVPLGDTNTIIDQRNYTVDGITSPYIYYNCLPDGCYQLMIKDSNGDGWLSQDYPAGYLKITDNDGKVMAEMTPSNAGFGSQTQFDFCVGPLSVQELKKDNFVIYPNPSYDQLIVQSMDEGQIQNIKIMDIEGKIVKDINFSQPVSEYQIKHTLQSGVYLVEVEINHLKTVRKIVVE